MHLCQGYEPVDYEARLAGESLTERYERKGWYGAFQRLSDRAKFRKRIRGFERVYRLPTVKAAVSKHLAALIAGRYKQPCALIQNGIDDTVFHPGAEEPGETERSGSSPLARRTSASRVSPMSLTQCGY